MTSMRGEQAFFTSVRLCRAANSMSIKYAEAPISKRPFTLSRFDNLIRIRSIKQGMGCRGRKRLFLVDRGLMVSIHMVPTVTGRPCFPIYPGCTSMSQHSSISTPILGAGCTQLNSGEAGSSSGADSSEEPSSPRESGYRFLNDPDESNPLETGSHIGSRQAMDDMNVELWSKLPTEVVERTLSFLSVPVLCRFRTVCKRWDALICEPGFRALCFLHEERDAYYLVARCVVRGETLNARYILEGRGEVLVKPFGLFDKNHGWSILDVSARRWYTIKHDGQEVFDRFIGGTNLGTDGGLVCQILEGDDDEDGSLFVSNPIAKTSERLPSSPYHRFTRLARVNMIVENTANTYKVFVMGNSKDAQPISAVNLLMVVYESTTNQWHRCSTVLPVPQTNGAHIHVVCSIFFDGLLYVALMFQHAGSSSKYCIWSYNQAEDAWLSTGINIHVSFLRDPQLIVSDNRLFLVSWLRRLSSTRQGPDNQATDGEWLFEIRDINAEDRTRDTVFRMSRAAMEQVFDVPHTDPCVGHHTEPHIWSPPYGLKVFGFRKSIIFLCRLSGVSKLFDLGTRSWDSLPKNPLEPLPWNPWVDGDIVWYGKPMNLILPATTP